MNEKFYLMGGLLVFSLALGVIVEYLSKILKELKQLNSKQ